MNTPAHDVFVCHASEDKARFVEPLVAALEGLGLKVWYDAFEIRLGDSFRQKMNEGLRGSRFGVVMVSPRSSKYWTDAELDSLFNQEAHDAGRPPRILPVRCDLTTAELTARDPLLAARASVGWELGVGEVARRIAAVVRAERPARVARSPVYGVPRRRAKVLAGQRRAGDPLRTLRARRSRRVITSALDDELAMDSGPVPGHSLFTGCLIEGLTWRLGEGGPRIVTGSEIGLYLQRQVKAYPSSNQTPGFGTFNFDNRGELTIAVGTEREPAASPGPSSGGDDDA